MDFIIEQEERDVERFNRKVVLGQAAIDIAVGGMSRVQAIGRAEDRYAAEQDAIAQGHAVEHNGSIDFPTLSRPTTSAPSSSQQHKQAYAIHKDLCKKEGLD